MFSDQNFCRKDFRYLYDATSRLLAATTNSGDVLAKSAHATVDSCYSAKADKQILTKIQFSLFVTQSR